MISSPSSLQTFNIQLLSNLFSPFGSLLNSFLPQSVHLSEYEVSYMSSPEDEMGLLVSDGHSCDLIRIYS